MTAGHIVRVLFSTMMIGTLYTSTAQAQDSASDLATAIKEVKQAEADFSRKKGAEHEAMIADKFMDIHGSGWLYTKQESAEMGRNLDKSRPKRGPIKTDMSEEHIVAYTRDAVVISRMTTTYNEVPNPQDEARMAGTMTDDPVAVARAIRMHPPQTPPGETADSPNPYRTRQTNLWLRLNGHWQLALSNSTRVGLKAQPGR